MVNLSRKLCLRPAWCTAAFSAIVMAAWFTPAPGQAPRPQSLEPSAAAGDASMVVREGTELGGVLGHFTLDDERLTFHSGDRRWNLQALENLALERIAETLAEATHDLQWTVDGRVTEYRGANYLLVTRAVVRRHAASQRGF